MIGLNTTPSNWHDVDLAADAELKRRLTEGDGALDNPEQVVNGEPVSIDEFKWDFWWGYPLAGRKNLGAVEQWCKSILEPLPGAERGQLQQAILDGLTAACASREWAKEDGRYICAANTFLENRKWLDSWASAESDEDAAYIAAQYEAANRE